MNDAIKIIGKARLQEIRGITALDRFKLKYFSNGKLRSVLNLFPAQYEVLQDTGLSENLIPNVAKGAMAGLFANTGSVNPFTYLALGTSATAAAAGDTILGTEITDTGLARTVASISRTTTTQTNDTVNYTYTWTASGSKNINEIGLFNASSSGVLGGHKILTSTITTNNGNPIIGTYTIQFT